MPGVGFTGCSSHDGLYARKHNPWVNFSDVPASANQPFTSFPTNFTSLPTVSFVVPNLQNDMHDLADSDSRHLAQGSPGRLHPVGENA